MPPAPSTRSPGHFALLCGQQDSPPGVWVQPGQFTQAKALPLLADISAFPPCGSSSCSPHILLSSLSPTLLHPSVCPAMSFAGGILPAPLWAVPALSVTSLLPLLLPPLPLPLSLSLSFSLSPSPSPPPVPVSLSKCLCLSPPLSTSVPGSAPLMFLCHSPHPHVALSSASLIHMPQVFSPAKPDALIALWPAPLLRLPLDPISPSPGAKKTNYEPSSGCKSYTTNLGCSSSSENATR